MWKTLMLGAIFLGSYCLGACLGSAPPADARANEKKMPVIVWLEKLDKRVEELDKRVKELQKAASKPTVKVQPITGKIQLTHFPVLVRGPGYEGLGDNVYGDNPQAIRGGVGGVVWDGSDPHHPAERVIGAWLGVGGQPKRYVTLGNFHMPEVSGLKVGFHKSTTAPAGKFIWLEVYILYVER